MTFTHTFLFLITFTMDRLPETAEPKPLGKGQELSFGRQTGYHGSDLSEGIRYKGKLNKSQDNRLIYERK